MDNPYEPPKTDSRRKRVYIPMDNLDRLMVSMAVTVAISLLWMFVNFVLATIFVI